MTNRTPAQLAGDAAEAIRLLTHATGPRPGPAWEDPDDAYEVIRGLAASAFGLIQSLEQVSHLLYDLQSAGRIVSTDGKQKTESQVLSTRSALRRARVHAESLGGDLRDALTAASALVLAETETDRSL
ncbi:hypothetical protein [Streptomyces sp. NPDC055036]